jgi:glutamate/tyrosine decarboxylase-like PLP-dependent enzyme
MLDDMLDYVAQIRQRPVWQPAPDSVEQVFSSSIPSASKSLRETHDCFMQSVLPYTVGNSHPGFMGWVHGGGTVVGMLAEMLASGLNSNLGGRDQIPIQVEQQVVRWMQELFGFPASASGLFVTGSSMANLIGLLVARTSKIGTGVRAQGLQQVRPKLIAYTSCEAHSCLERAMEMTGLGGHQLRKIPVNELHQMNLKAFEETVADDQALGLTPFCVIGTAGTVNVGAIDDLSGIAAIAIREGLWFHVDGACGALGMMSPRIGAKMLGIEQADSIALDFHKWGQVPYDAGFVLMRNSQLHYDTFASQAEYLRRETRGMAAGSPWPCDFGPDLSRSFKALKVWFTMQVYGTARLAKMMERTCELAEYLASRIAESAELELLAPVNLNIVCFRYRCDDADRVNAEIVVAIQESGIAAPSSTTIGGKLAIRAAIFNHRTSQLEIDSLIEASLRFGRSISQAI